MTAPIQEPSVTRALQSFAYQRDQIFRRPVPEADPQYAIKLFSDDPTQGVTVVGDDRFRFTIPHTLPDWYLSYVEIGLGTADSGTTSCQLSNVDNGNVDMLSTVVSIDAGEVSSQFAATPFVINTANDQVDAGDRIAVDVDSGSDGTGLHIYVWFSIVRPA